MPIYVILSKLTDDGRETIKDNPFRIFEVNKEIEEMGVKVLQQYAVLGPYDFVNIVEAPNNEAIVKMSIELGSRGTVELMSLPAIPVEELLKIIKK
ncbi:MAG: GYD domain-containing protein [Thermodesulfobacteriaceae bacterium]|nr:GYD domain-containing protein [Thermodesulfobacteriaceae bacterium]MCX8041413.1 GYD domain-containing protein [Thermodesulfobacteriaceae bacterium]MDW8135831.1 GYD domain-containing protein [Thermodesulfobacterium sp.]